MKSDKFNKKYVDIKFLSEYTSLPVKTLYEWASTGKFPSSKIEGRVLFDLVDVDRFIASLKRPYNQSEETANKVVGAVHGNDI